MNAQPHSSSLSPTAVICENLERFGGAPARGEPDTRAVWDESEALAGLDSILDAFVDEVAPDGVQLADERESLLWGFVNTLHMQMTRLDRQVDKLAPKLKELQHAQDGTEINAWELERVIERAQNLGDRRDAFEQLRDFAAQRYLADTGKTWRPRSGSHTSGRVSSPPPPSTPGTSNAPGSRPRRKRTCPKARWSPSRAPSRSRTPTPSSARWTTCTPSTPTWCWCTAADRARRWSRPAGRSPAACTR